MHAPELAPFPDRLRLPLDFDPERLAGDLVKLSDISWTRHFVQQNYEGEWSAIALRAPKGAQHPIQMIVSNPGTSEYVATPFLDAAPYFRSLLGEFECALLAVRLMRLGPGSVIKEHSDHDLSFEQGTVRLHIPVLTNDRVDFRLNGTRCVMPAGSTWYLRLSDRHSVANQGTTDRVHMVIDAAVNGWVKDLFTRAIGTESGQAA
jgi:Aspartyl/Asparaginyl beta-hydroxylase